MNPIVFIPLTQGKVAVVDFDDFELVRGFTWRVSNVERRFYVSRSIFKKNLNGSPVGSSVRMHIHIMGALRIDHRNGNGLDNRRCNLRILTPGQNARSFHHRNAKYLSRFRGVCRTTNKERWRVQIRFNYKREHLGVYDSEIEAARAYDAAAVKYGFSEEALNFPPPRPDDFEVL